MSPGSHRAAFSGVTLIMRQRLPTVGWVRFSKAPKTYHPRRIGRFVIFRSWIQDSWMKMTFIWFFYRYFFVVDCSAVTGRFSLSSECVTVLFSCRHGERAPGQRSHWSARFCPSRGLPERGCVSGKPKETLQFWVDLCEYKEYLKFINYRQCKFVKRQCTQVASVTFKQLSLTCKARVWLTYFF